MWKAMRSRNTCKTCALGMGGQLGGMVNEGGHFPEVCKKSFQAMASDMQGAISPEFFARYGVNELKALTPRELEISGRLSQPVYLGPGEKHYRPISWDEALDRVAKNLRDAGPQHSFFYASGRSSNEAGFLLQLLSRLFGTNYVNNCSYYCHQASGVGLASSMGVGTGTIQLHDLDGCDLYILIGGNPASNHPRMMRSLMEIRRRGGKVIVVNPVKELGLVKFRVPSDPWSLLFGSEIASQYVQPHIGGDIAWLTGVCKELLERGVLDQQFIDQHTEGFADFKTQVAAANWAQIEVDSGVSRASMAESANTYAQAKNVVIGWTMGITHHLHGVENVQMIANLALMRGMVGRKNAGMMPIRGHSNVQGIGSVGVTPQLKVALLERFEKRLGVELPKSPGLDTMACVDASHRGEMHTALCLGGNLYGSNPDAAYAAEAMQKLNLVTYMSTTLNTGHAWGLGKETLILPVLPRDEEPQPTTQESMFSYVRLSSGGPSRIPGARSEVSVLVDIAQKVLGNDGPVRWSELHSHSAIRNLIADLIPGYEQVKDIDKTSKEFHIPGRNIEGRTFPTASGRAKFHAIVLPQAADLNGNKLRLMTVRSEGQFNSVVYDEEDIYRAQERRDVVLMNAADLQRLGLQPEQRVRLRNSTGEMRWLLARPFDIRAGNALVYYPESNVLVPRDVDPKSKTPAFKSVMVEVLPESAG
jgi:molybdopterin-dependent oxidoreductase alpha subunit